MVNAPDTSSITAFLNNDGGDGISLWEAIAATNGMTGADTIDFAATISGQTITLGGTELEITEELTIDATALAQNVTIDADNASRIFNITAATGDFTLAGLTLIGGRTTGNSANNSDTTFSGGAIRSLTTGNFTINQSTISENSTVGSYGYGGGILSTGNITLTSSTVSGNSANISGGILAINGDVTLTSSTISGNSTAGSGAYGGEIFSVGVILTNSSVTDTPLLGPLANNGGSTQTHALLPRSPAIDTGDLNIATPPDFDQRGAPFAHVVDGLIDIGAYEVQPVVVDSADFDTDGDIDGDIDGADFLAWQRGFGTPSAIPSNGDANDDQIVDATDLTVWEDQYGTTTATVAAASAPFADFPPLASAPEVALAAFFIDAAFIDVAFEEDQRDGSIVPVPTVLETPRQRVFAEYAPLRKRGDSADFDAIAASKSRSPKENSSIDATLDWSE